jgi:hypothetical protein
MDPVGVPGNRGKTKEHGRVKVHGPAHGPVRLSRGRFHDVSRPAATLGEAWAFTVNERLAFIQDRLSVLLDNMAPIGKRERTATSLFFGEINQVRTADRMAPDNQACQLVDGAGSSHAARQPLG